MITIVVPTVPGRESLLSRCLWSIQSQPGECRVLVVDGNGRLGDKVNAAAEVAVTSHMTIVDDDDYLDGAYLVSVNEHLDVDYIGFNFLEIEDGEFFNVCASRADADGWGRRTRGPVPKGITTTAIYRQVEFGNDYQADRRWSEQVAELVTTHHHIDRALYIHDWRPTHSTFTGSQHRSVGTWPVDEDRIERLTITR